MARVLEATAPTVGILDPKAALPMTVTGHGATAHLRRPGVG